MDPLIRQIRKTRKEIKYKKHTYRKEKCTKSARCLLEVLVLDV